MKVYKKLFDKIIEPENLFWAWKEFKYGKGKKADVLKFEKNLEQELFQLHRDLKDKTYRHAGYADFFICDPKLRHIHKATVRDRVLHHAVYQILNPLFEPTFIATSFSCRIQKGSHKGVDVAEKMIRKVSRNYTRACYVLKCDVRKFFDSIDHLILKSLLFKRIGDFQVMELMKELIGSYKNEAGMERENTSLREKGIPIGNLTSQLFANIYMSEFDHFMKSTLKIRYYARYTDDFIVVSGDKKYLESLIEPISLFLGNHLKLQLHPHKVEILKASGSVDFLGYILRPYHRLMRKRTLKRVKRKLNEKFSEFTQGTTSKESFKQTFASYLGVLSHANTYKLRENLKNRYWFWKNK